MTVKHTLASSDMRVFALCSLMELHRGQHGPLQRQYRSRHLRISDVADDHRQGRGVPMPNSLDHGHRNFVEGIGGYRFAFARMALQQSCGSQKSSLPSMKKGRPVQTAPTSGQHGPRLFNLPETDTERICLRPAPKAENQPPLAAHTAKGGRRGTEIQSRR